MKKLNKGLVRKETGSLKMRKPLTALAVMAFVCAGGTVLADYEASVLMQDPAVYYRLNSSDTESEMNLGWLNVGDLSFVNSLTRGVVGPDLAGFESSNKALSLTGGFAQFNPLNTSVSEMTIMAWVKTPATRNQHQPGIVMSRDPNVSGTATGLEFKTTTYRLGYHWGDTAVSYNYTQGPVVTGSAWYFLAVSVNADKAFFYTGDASGNIETTENFASHTTLSMVSPFYIGKDPVASGDRSLTANDGEAIVDEVVIFLRALDETDLSSIYYSGLGKPYAPTYASIRPSAEVIYAGGNETLTVYGNGGSCQIEWYLNGEKISATDRVLTDLQAGVYTAKLTNSLGSVTTDGFEVLAASKPVITQQPASATRYENGQVTFSVENTGSTPFSYQWKLNGKDIEGATEQTLTIKNLTVEDFGSYTVEVSNSSGSVLSSAAVLKQQPAEADSYARIVMDYAPLAYYRLDDVIDPSSTEGHEASGFAINGTAYDYAGGNDALYLNCLGDNKVSGAIKNDPNQAVHFDGMAMIETPLKMNSLANSGFTVMGWVKRSLNYGGYTETAGYMGQNSLFVLGDASGNRIEALLRDLGNGSVDSLYTTWPFADNTWGFLACVYNGEQMDLYADGINVGTFYGNSPMTAGADYLFSIGGGVRTLYNDFFLGDIDEVAVFDSALSESTVREIFNRGCYGAGSPPVIQTQPVGISGYENADRIWTINVVVGGTAPFSYQWYKDGQEIEGAIESSLNGTFIAEAEGSYTVSISNMYGSVTSSAARIALHIPAANSYEDYVYQMDPYAYWRLGETTGMTAYDYAGGKNGVYTDDNIRGTAGAINGDSDKATGFGGKDQIITEPLGITGSANLTFAAWIKPAGKLGANDKATLLYNRSGTTDHSATGIDLAAGQIAYHWGDGFYEYRSGLYLLENEWNFVVMTVSPTEATFYLGDKQGNLKKAVNAGTHNPVNLLARFTLGGDSFYGERKIIGDLDEAVVFDRTLSQDEVSYLYNLGLVGSGSKPELINEPEGFNGLYGDEYTLKATAKGTPPMIWQWYKDGVAIEGATSSELVISGEVEESGSYTVEVSNDWGSDVSEAVAVEVIYPPYSIDLSDGLFAHLRFDNSYADSSINGNNVEPGGEPTFVDGFLGSALHVSTDANEGISNYAYFAYGLEMMDVPLTVSFWTRLDSNIPNLPWLSNTEKSYGDYGFNLAPSNGTGGWSWSLMSLTDDTSSMAQGPDNGLALNEWQHLVFVMIPGQTMKVFQNGVLVNTTDISGVTPGLETGLPMTIGQTGSGYYDVMAQMDIDDMGIWKKALTDVEARSIYYVALNGFSFDEKHDGNVPPTVVIQPKGYNGYVNPRVSKTLSVAVGGPWPRTVEWFRDGESTGLFGESVSIALTADAAGSYIAKVSNPYGSVESEPAVLDLIPVAAGSYTEFILTMDPYAYWRLGEAQGTTTVYEHVNNKIGEYAADQILGQPGAIADDSDTSVSFTGNSQVIAEPMNITTANITFLAWIKPLDTRRSTILFDRLGIGLGKQTSGLEIIDSQLCYHWNDIDTSYNYRSGLRPVVGVWNLVALCVSPTEATFYLGTADNGLSSKANVVAHNPVLFAAPFTIGGDMHYTDRNFAGDIDEAVVFDRTLSADEIQAILDKGLNNSPVVDAELLFEVNGNGTLTLLWDGNSKADLLMTPTIGEEWSVVSDGIIKVDGYWTYTLPMDEKSVYFALRQ